MKTRNNIRLYTFTTCVWMSMSICWGSGESIKKEWYMKRAQTPLQLYASSDIVGQARLDAFHELPEQQTTDHFQVQLSVNFTNTLKGEVGPCNVFVNRRFQDPDRSDLSAFTEEPTEEENAAASGSNWKWEVGKIYILLCSYNPERNRWELHSAVAQEWPNYVEQIRIMALEHHYWRKERIAHGNALVEKMEKNREAMKLGDITPEEYEKRADEYLKENSCVGRELTNDTLSYAPGVGKYLKIDWGVIGKEWEESK